MAEIPDANVTVTFSFTCGYCGEPLDAAANHRCGWAYTPSFPECPTDGERPRSFVCRRGHVHPIEEQPPSRPAGVWDALPCGTNQES